MGGVGEQVHVGEGHVGIVGKGGGLWWEEMWRRRNKERGERRGGCHVDRAMGCRNMRWIGRS